MLPGVATFLAVVRRGVEVLGLLLLDVELEEATGLSSRAALGGVATFFALDGAEVLFLRELPEELLREATFLAGALLVGLDGPGAGTTSGSGAEINSL